MGSVAFLPFMFVGIAMGAFLCDSAAAGWHRIKVTDVVVLIGLHALIVAMIVFFETRQVLGYSARMWAFASTLSYAVGLIGIIFALGPEMLF